MDYPIKIGTGYGFTNGECDSLTPPTVYKYWGHHLAYPASVNKATLAGNGNMAQIIDLRSGGGDGFEIEIASDVENKLAVGIYLGSTALYIARAVPNTTVVIPKPSNTYYMAVSSCVKRQILDADSLIATSAKIDFTSPDETIHVSLETNGSWSVSS